jgi:ATP-dependent Clp protease ATP-binding subunit ClpA
MEDFTRDLTLAALYDELEPVECRDLEIERVITTLLRQSKNNPVLIGEAGVGKTAVVEGLALRVSTGKVPHPLRSARILSLSHVDLLAGTSFRGQYEKRLQAVIKEASNDQNILLFIDELHNLIGAGSALGAPMDAANMLKPALSSGQLRVIGATTEIEYNRYIRADPALERRFQPVHIGELSREQTIDVLRARRPRLETHHLLAIEEEAIEAAVDKSIEYLPDRKQPDRSIDLLDETCARVKLRHTETAPDEVLAVASRRERLEAEERKLIEQIIELAGAKGTPMERFSRGTFKLFENLGLGIEKILTGQTTSRAALPMPESIQRLQESDPANRLARFRYERLVAGDELKESLIRHGLKVTAADVEETLKLQPK